MHRQRRTALIAVAILVALTVPAIAGGTWVKTRIGLHSTDNDPLASGKAIFREKDLGIRRTIHVEVEDVTSALSVNVFVNDQLVGGFNLVAGSGQIELDTRDGDTVPVIGFGTTVKVRDASDGSIVVKGRNH